MKRDAHAVRSGAKPAFLALPEQLPCPPLELRGEMSWLDFSGTANPLGTPASFTRAIARALESGLLSCTPDFEAHTLRSILSQQFDLPIESFLVGSSVGRMVSAAASAFSPCTVGISTPCPVGLVLAVGNAGHALRRISRPQSLVVPDFAALDAREGAVAAAVLANPGYPTSRLLPKRTLLSYVDACDWVIVDERSIELTLGGESMVPLVAEHPNLIVVQSFSEQYALAGGQVSYCVAHPDTIAQIEKFFDRSCVSMLPEVLARPSVSEHAALDKVREFLDAEIPWMQCMLSLVPGIDIFPAEANYVMCSFHNDRDLKLGVANVDELCARLQLAGFLVRKLANMPGLGENGYFCVAVRTRAHNERLIEALRGIMRS